MRWLKVLRANWQNARYVFWHKVYVFQAGRVLGVPVKRLVLHDLSKFSRAEWWPYANFFHMGPFPTRAEVASGAAPAGPTFEDAKSVFKKAWQHHILKNDHHPEHFTRDGRRGEQMPGDAVREMVADWWAAGQAQKKGEGELSVWYDANRERFAKILGDARMELVDMLVSRLSLWEAGVF